ncbi:hypothetical protein Tco_1241477 [Tanacetum coccineum]
MSSITAQQAKLDLELVPKEKRFEIGKCNGRLNPGKTQREPTFQVVLDALALTLCYSAFLTTADVPEICPRVHGQDFDELPTHEVIVLGLKSFLMLLVLLLLISELMLLSCVSTAQELQREKC